MLNILTSLQVAMSSIWWVLRRNSKILHWKDYRHNSVFPLCCFCASPRLSILKFCFLQSLAVLNGESMNCLTTHSYHSIVEERSVVYLLPFPNLQCRLPVGSIKDEAKHRDQWKRLPNCIVSSYTKINSNLQCNASGELKDQNAKHHTHG